MTRILPRALLIAIAFNSLLEEFLKSVGG